MNANFRNFAIWLVILFMLMGLFQVFQSSTHSISVADKSYSQFVSDVDNGTVNAVTITDSSRKSWSGPRDARYVGSKSATQK